MSISIRNEQSTPNRQTGPKDTGLFANLFVLLALATLLVDCRCPCVWMNLTTVFRKIKSRSVPLLDAKLPVCCS